MTQSIQPADARADYLKALERAKVFRMERSRLVMRDAGGTAMVAFVRTESTAAQVAS